MILDRKSFEHIYYLYGRRLINFACNSCLDYQRHASVENTEDSERLFSLLMLGEVSDQTTIYRQLETELRQIVEKLPARCREIFTLSLTQYAS